MMTETTTSRQALENEQTEWAYTINMCERGLARAYRMNDLEQVEKWTAELRAARVEHSTVTDRLLALDGLRWNASSHRWETI